MSEPIDGILERIIWQGPSYSGSTRIIGKLHDGKTVMGEIAKPRTGESYRFWGEWLRSKPPYSGFDFNFSSYEVVVDQSTDGVSQYLRSYIDGLGTVKSTAIVEHFGLDTLKILRISPERALEVKGITQDIVDRLSQHWEEIGAHDPAAEARLIEMFRGHKIPKYVIKKLMQSMGSDAPERVLRNPYRLLDFKRLGWKTVDSFARSIAGYPADGKERHQGAILEAFAALARDGHTCGTMEDVNALATGYLGMPVDMKSWGALAADGKVVAHKLDGSPLGGPRYFALAKYAHAEVEIAERLTRLMGARAELPGDVVVEGLEGEQVEAAEVILKNNVSLLVGGPGTGKSHLVSRLVQALIKSGISSSNIIYTAPTGKAAQRGRELLIESGIIDVSCSTIHKALAPVPSTSEAGINKRDAKNQAGRETFSFSRNESNPISARFIIVDEVGMLDTLLQNSLIKAISPGTRILFVGDENQLPSVGPGSTLRDMLEAKLPTARLTQIRRSDKAGTVVRACHAIMAGIVPEPADKIDLDNGKNWIHIEQDNPFELTNEVIAMHASPGKFDPKRDMQVVTAQKEKHPFSTKSLNPRLSQLLNPVATQHAQLFSEDPADSFTPAFFIDDKVIRMKNAMADEMVTKSEYLAAQDRGEEWAEDPWHPAWTFRGVDYMFHETLVVNGDMGTVLDIITIPKIGRQVVVEFTSPKRLYRLPHGESEIMQAYVLTLHRCQGSGFDVVIVPVHNSIYWDAKKQVGLFTREWIYTAISRTKTLCITVGQFSAIRAAVGRKTVHLRKTRLMEMLRDKMKEMREAEKRKATLALIAPTPLGGQTLKNKADDMIDDVMGDIAAESDYDSEATQQEEIDGDGVMVSVPDDGDDKDLEDFDLPF